MTEKMSKQPPPHLLQAQQALALLLPKLIGRPGTGSLPSTFAPPENPLDCLYVRLFDRIGE